MKKSLVSVIAVALAALLGADLPNRERHFDRLSPNATFYSRNNADPFWDGPNR